jgi:hypothetical protein
MTVQETVARLQLLIQEGHSQKKLGYYDHEYHDFVEITDIVESVNRDYDPETREEVIELK